MNLPRHCRENATFFQRYDDMDLRMTSRGVKTAFRFIEVPDFYTINEREYFAVSKMFMNKRKRAASCWAKIIF